MQNTKPLFTNPPFTASLSTLPVLDPAAVRAITLDLDDTLWPIAPVIDAAELALQQWLAPRAPGAARQLAQPERRMALRSAAIAQLPQQQHDLSAIRLGMLRLALAAAAEDAALAQPAFEVFFEARHQVRLYEDARPALAALAARFPLVAVSNGNADVYRMGLGEFFVASVSARDAGVAKPDARIFHAAAQRVGHAAQHVLHVGDDAHLDVLGALAVGMQTAWVNREAHAWTHHPLQPHATVRDMAQLCAVLGVEVALEAGAGGRAA